MGISLSKTPMKLAKPLHNMPPLQEEWNTAVHKFLLPKQALEEVTLVTILVLACESLKWNRSLITRGHSRSRCLHQNLSPALGSSRTSPPAKKYYQKFFLWPLHSFNSLLSAFFTPPLSLLQTSYVGGPPYLWNIPNLFAARSNPITHNVITCSMGAVFFPLFLESN